MNKEFFSSDKFVFFLILCVFMVVSVPLIALGIAGAFTTICLGAFVRRFVNATGIFVLAATLGTILGILIMPVQFSGVFASSGRFSLALLFGSMFAIGAFAVRMTEPIARDYLGENRLEW